jgi:hypothetical protein
MDQLSLDTTRMGIVCDVYYRKRREQASLVRD